MTLMKKFGLIFFAFLLAVFSSCSARFDGVVKEGGAAVLTLKTALEPRTSALIRSIKNFMGDGGDGPVLDGQAMGRSMAAAPGIGSVSLKNTGPSALEGGISITNIGNFLVRGGAKSKFITYTEGRAAGTSSIVIVLDRQSAPEIIATLSPEIEEYLSALMAPAVLGEDSTKQEYLDLLASIYGRPLSNEIAGAKVSALIEFPRTVTTALGGQAKGKQAEFDIPLVDILVLENPLRYEVSW